MKASLEVWERIEERTTDSEWSIKGLGRGIYG